MAPQVAESSPARSNQTNSTYYWVTVHIENSAIRICKVDETGFNNDIYKSNVHSN